MVAPDKGERGLQENKKKLPQIITCDRCGHEGSNLHEKWYKGDPEWDEWLCEGCWEELGELGAHNRPIIDEIVNEFKKEGNA